MISESTSPAEPHDMNRKTVLIIDDEPLSVKILCHQLERDFDVITADGGAAALQIVSHTIPDIILLDIVMPEMDGYQVFNAFRVIPALTEVPILFITASDDEIFEVRGLEMGPGDYIHKPFNPDLIRLRINNHLAFSQKRSELFRRNQVLEETVANMKQLEGVIPICMYCKKIRDDEDSWNQLETYISKRSGARFSHGICPQCADEQKKIVKIQLKEISDSEKNI